MQSGDLIYIGAWWNVVHPIGTGMDAVGGGFGQENEAFSLLQVPGTRPSYNQ